MGSFFYFSLLQLIQRLVHYTNLNTEVRLLMIAMVQELVPNLLPSSPRPSPFSRLCRLLAGKKKISRFAYLRMGL